MKTISMETMPSDWKVLIKKKTPTCNYYLLQSGNDERIHKAVKESLVNERFSGKIMDIPDVKKTFKKQELKAVNKHSSKYIDIEEPYIHRLNDYGLCSDTEMKMFGDSYDIFIAELESDSSVTDRLLFKKEKKVVNKKS